jgi:hypothetical protein
MKKSINLTDVELAADDLRRHTLSHMPEPLERMIYLGSTRDYNTGLYYHDGLASRFSDEVACEALANCHRESYRHAFKLFRRGFGAPDRLLHSIHTCCAACDFIAAWKSLQPYRVAVPGGHRPLAVEFLCGNVRVALAIWAAHQDGRSRQRPDASPQLSPVR